MDNKSTDKLVLITVIMLVIFTKFKSSPNCLVTKCAACQLACEMKWNTNEIKQGVIPEKKRIVSWGKYKLVNVCGSIHC